ncbi:DUF2141 domain-containing protein [Pedobacter sp. N23S346]|uniref:DUF2141 domain-containing protein n=1 Tax=Pedobacter sp. N23S346 TaxID=3402750 RepID=UPI003AC39348
MKKNRFLPILLFSCIQLIFSTAQAQSQELRVKVSDIRSAKGKIILNVFKDEASYEKQQPYTTLSFDKKAISNGVLMVKGTVATGIYGITLIDDENGNGKLEKNFMGIPKEGFGFSNFFMTKMKKPAFNEFKFELKPGSSVVEIKTKYM